VAANAALDESKGATSATELAREIARNNLDKIMCEVCLSNRRQKAASEHVEIFLREKSSTAHLN
jgi:hypothetical protein